MQQGLEKRPPHLTVGEFFTKYQEELDLELQGSSVGFKREIEEPTINRPGLALAGFFEYFAFKRIQVIGHSDRSYLESLSHEDQIARFTSLCEQEIPCLVIARGFQLPDYLLQVVNQRGISVLVTSMISMKFINAATLRLEWESAPYTTLHGSMVEVRGMGVLIQGESGAGKSECVLSLLDRGAGLVADDVVRLRRIDDRYLVGTAPEITRYFMEVRGLGLINAAALFGVSAISFEKRLDFAVTLVPAANINELERIGLEPKFTEILGLKIPLVELAVAPGRNMGKLIEVAALSQKLRSRGYEMAEEFSRKLLKKMSGET